MTRLLTSARPWWPLLASLALGVLLTAVASATVRVKVAENETVEALAERYYGDARRAPIIRAMNKLSDGEQPVPGIFLKLPGPTIHTVQAGETLQKVADRFLSAEGGAELLAEANQLARDVAIKPGQVLTIFAEIEVRTAGRSAEELAVTYLGESALGARIRRYNGAPDGGKLPSRVYVPLIGVEPASSVAQSGIATAPSPASGSSAPSSAAVDAAPIAAAPAPAVVVPAPPSVSAAPVAAVPSVSPPSAGGPLTRAPTGGPKVAPRTPAFSSASVPVPPRLDLSVPVTGKRATLAGFSHALHTPMKVGGASVGCLACHERTAPGSVTHRAPTKESCMLCHKESDEMPAQLRSGQLKRLPLPMNHKLHVQNGALDCTVCHRNDAGRALGIMTNGHEACTVCHSAISGRAPIVGGDASGQACTGCHGATEEVDAASERTRYLRAHLTRPVGRVGDVSFTHLNHAALGAGGAAGSGPTLGCKMCHIDADTAETKEQISRVQMQGCQECHRQARAIGLQPPESCAGCHVDHRSGLMPTNDLIEKKPIDHTAFFRRHHEDAARSNAPLCASCHVGTAGNDGNRCDTCHVQMRPRDHTAGFRDKVHGRQSQIDPARCQACHRAERCEACHREVPRSHFPYQAWVEQGLHGSRGRLEMGACLTCHRFETTCSRCHTAVAN